MKSSKIQGLGGLEKNRSQLSGFFSVNPPPVKRSNEMIIELIVTTNQIAVLYNSNCNWISSLILGVGLEFLRLLWGGGIDRKDRLFCALQTDVQQQQCFGGRRAVGTGM